MPRRSRLSALVVAAALVGAAGVERSPAQSPAPTGTPAAAASTAAAGTESPRAVAEALEQRYRTVKDFSADFVQTYRGGALRTQAREHGTVRIKKPGLMRWVYASPEKKEFVSDGRTIYSYFPADRQVMVTRVPSDLEATTPALFLAGKADIARDFVADFSPSPVPGTIGLKLTPRRREANIEYFVVSTSQPGLQIRALTARDAQGGDSTLLFSNMVENKGIADKEFAFRIPKGVDVVTNGSVN